MRYYETFYGVELTDMSKSFGKFSNHHKLLVKDYKSEACRESSYSSATDSNKFLYPHHIKKTYFIEGTISGHITLVASGCTSHVTDYKVSVCKMNADNTDVELFTTGWVSVDIDLAWNNTYSVGEEAVIPFEIDAWEKEKLTEFDRIYVKVETTSSYVSDGCYTQLWHENNATWEDLKIEIPFILP